MATFGAKLKALRFHFGFSQEEMGNFLNTSKQNISRYENEQNSPRIDTVDLMAKKLGVDLTFLINDHFSTNEVITAMERNTSIYQSIQKDTKHSPTIERTVQTMRRLNDDGQEIVANTADGLDKSGQYKRAPEPDTTSDKVIPYRTITVHTDGAVAAGYGCPNDWSTKQEHTVITSAANLSYDHAVDIDGDSMYPTYEDGGLAYIRLTTDYRDGHVYAVKVNGEDYIKRCYFYKDHIEMVSDNKDFDPIIPSPDTDDIKIIGEVVGYTPPENVDA